MRRHSGKGTDYLWVSCHICGVDVASETVLCGVMLPPWKVIRLHERAINHVRKEHLRRTA
jgi:hypothetical protein